MPGAVRGNGFIRKRIKLAGASVALNGRVELLHVEGLEPGTKPRKLARGELFDGFFDIFRRWSYGKYSIFARYVKGGLGRNRRA